MASTELRTAAQQALEAKQVPLRELLASVPADARLVIHDADGKGTRSIPVGRLCHEAAAALAEPVQEPDSPERRCGGPGCDMTCCQPVQEPFALPCPTPKACKAHCCSGHCVPRTNHQNDMTRIPPMLCIPHRIPDCPKCMSTHTFPPQRKPLTEEEIQAAWDSVDMRHPRGNETRIAFARAVERAHGIGGEG